MTFEIRPGRGDMTTTRVDGTFSLVYLVYNSINNVTTQEGQTAAFANAAAHLEPRGCFVIEVGVPPSTAWSVFALNDTHVGVDEYDADTQRLVSHHILLRDGQWKRGSGEFRAVFPAELDLMARLAGLEQESRADGWRGAPVTASSAGIVSVWRKPA